MNGVDRNIEGGARESDSAALGKETGMTAYWIAHGKINTPGQYSKYAEQVPGILAKYDGKVLARGGEHKALEGPDDFPRHVVIEFPSLERAEACFNSDEYQAAAAHRRADGAGEVRIVIVDGQ